MQVQARPLPVRHGLLPARPTPPFCPVRPARPAPPAYPTRRTSPTCPARPRSQAEAARPAVHALRQSLLHTGPDLHTGQQPLRPWPWHADLLQFLGSVATRPPGRPTAPDPPPRRRSWRRGGASFPPNPCRLPAPPAADQTAPSPRIGAPARPHRARTPRHRLPVKSSPLSPARVRREGEGLTLLTRFAAPPPATGTAPAAAAAAARRPPSTARSDRGTSSRRAPACPPSSAPA